MLATTHPDATAFAARFLANPTDRLGRLVFADWLDEQGGESNTFWARYLRYMAHVEEDFDGVFEERADSLGRMVRARLTLPKVPGTALLQRLTSLLPAHRICVRIGQNRISSDVLHLCPESTVRRFQAIPIGATGTEVFFACSVTGELESIRETLQIILAQRAVVFRGGREDIQDAIGAHYGWTLVESVGGMLVWPETEVD